MTDNPKTIAHLSAEKRDLLLRRVRAGHAPGRAGIQPREDPTAPIPLTFAQRRLWLVDQLQPGTSAYNVPLAVRITGPLDARILAATLRALVRHHPMLRTTIQEVNGEPVQVIAPGAGAPLAGVDLGNLAAERAERTAQELVVTLSRPPFDLRRGPLLRMTLLRTAAASHVLVLVFHHAVADLWSLAIFIRQLTAIYSSLAGGRPPVLPEPPIQYADYAAWQRRSLQGERLEREIEHWRQQLAGVPTSLDLPVDHRRPPVMRYRGVRLPVRFPGQVPAQRALAQRLEATPFMLLLAAYDVLLARFAGQERLAVGSPVANRSRVEVEELVGLFVNMLVLPADLRGNPSFRELLKRTRETCVQALSHQDLPFEQLVDDLELERDLSRPPLVQAALALQNVALPSLAIAGLLFTVLDVQIGITKFDLSLELFERDDALGGWLEYNTEIFEASTAERIGRCFSVLLEALAECLDQSIWELPLLDGGERRQLLAAAGRSVPAAAPRNLAAQVVEIARRRREAPAAVGKGGRILTYGELVERAGRVAGALRELGVGPETLVAILVERSPELLVAILGTLGAGGACLLLDPGHERSWLGRTLEAGSCSMVLTRGGLAGWLPEHGAAELLLERLEDRGHGLADWERIDPQSLAFVVQTAAPRQQPCLVDVPHRSLAAWTEAWRQRLAPADLVAVAGEGAAETVDGIFDLLVPLSLGGCAVLHQGAAVSLFSATPARLAAALGAGGLDGVRAVRSFGDRATAGLRRRLLAAGVERVYDSFSSAVGGVQPAEGLAAAVLGPLGVPAPIGAHADLWLGGEAPARGYRGDAARTAERFAPDPAGDCPGARRVGTGDLARWGAGGRLEILGPRARRIELGDRRLRLGAVEELLAEHSGVLQAAAGLQEDAAGRRLVAHAWCAGPDALGAAELREFLRARLPEPEVPRQVAVVAALPLTWTGRLDPRLLAPVANAEEAADAAPRTEVERVVAEIWRELLGVEAVGIHANFFRLGGNSLLATRAMARINEELQLSLGVELLFRGPTVAGLALAADEHLLAQLGEAGLESLLGEAAEAHR